MAIKVTKRNYRISFHKNGQESRVEHSYEGDYLETLVWAWERLNDNRWMDFDEARSHGASIQYLFDLALGGLGDMYASHYWVEYETTTGWKTCTMKERVWQTPAIKAEL